MHKHACSSSVNSFSGYSLMKSMAGCGLCKLSRPGDVLTVSCENRCIPHRHNLIVFAVNEESWNINLLEVLRKVVF
jgi:hypothetical protein